VEKQRRKQQMMEELEQKKADLARKRQNFDSPEMKKQLEEAVKTESRLGIAACKAGHIAAQRLIRGSCGNQSLAYQLRDAQNQVISLKAQRTRIEREIDWLGAETETLDEKLRNLM
jgi:hypothetical protein